MRRWLRKFVQVFAVVALGALAAIPFRRLPPPTKGRGESADRVVLQQEAGAVAPETPLQITSPPAAPAEGTGGEFVADSTSSHGTAGPSTEPRTASNRATQTSRKDLPAWNSKLEANSPPPPLPDSFGPRDDRSTTPIAAPEERENGTGLPNASTPSGSFLPSGSPGASEPFGGAGSP